MTEQPGGLRYECLEAGCDWKTEAPSEDDLVETVSRHMADAHDTFELEDVIIDNAVAATGEARKQTTE